MPLGTNVVINLGPLFNGTLDMRSLLPEFDGSRVVLGSLPDLTLGGLVNHRSRC